MGQLGRDPIGGREKRPIYPSYAQYPARIEPLMETERDEIKTARDLEARAVKYLNDTESKVRAAHNMKATCINPVYASEKNAPICRYTDGRFTDDLKYIWTDDITAK